MSRVQRKKIEDAELIPGNSEGQVKEPPAKVKEPEPPKDYRGDKTPAFVDWMFRNRPEEAATRYANRKISRQ